MCASANGVSNRCYRNRWVCFNHYRAGSRCGTTLVIGSGNDIVSGYYRANRNILGIGTNVPGPELPFNKSVMGCELLI